MLRSTSTLFVLAFAVLGALPGLANPPESSARLQNLVPQSLPRLTPPHLRHLPIATQAHLDALDIAPGAPVYIRIFKTESELEVWAQRRDGQYVLARVMPICTWSGRIGPKMREGDRQTPEGFYDVSPQLMKPDSAYHVAFNLGFPNALDKSLGRSGSLIMMHGKCRSAGCFAMTDRWSEEIYAFVRDAFAAGQGTVPVHVFPFRPTASAMKQHASHPWAATWAPLKRAFDDFEIERQPPTVAACERRYVVNADWHGSMPTSASEPCPPHEPRRLVAAAPTVTEEGFEVGPGRPIVSAGVKLRTSQRVAGLIPTGAPTMIADVRALRSKRGRINRTAAAEGDNTIARLEALR